MDMKITFLNGEVKEVIYLKQPLSLEIKGQEEKVSKLNKAFYAFMQVLGKS
jgi:hypothetical protein